MSRFSFFLSTCFLIFFLFFPGRTTNSIFADNFIAEGENIPSPQPGEEYPVAYWAQTHIQEALLLHKNMTSNGLESACKKGVVLASPPLQAAWKSFVNRRRIEFCEKYPSLTLHILGEAPYFMLKTPGSHK